MLFQKNILRKYLTLLPAEQMAEAWSTFQNYFLNADIQQNILQSKEEQFQEGFLRELFVKVLGYEPRAMVRRRPACGKAASRQPRAR